MTGSALRVPGMRETVLSLRPFEEVKSYIFIEDLQILRTF
jgi:hypothetical protein